MGNPYQEVQTYSIRRIANLEVKVKATNKNMDKLASPALTNQRLNSPKTSALEDFSELELAQALAEKLAISDRDWHQLKSNPKARANELTAAALIFLLKNQLGEALPRLEQAVGWLNHSVKAPPCPTHGVKAAANKSD